MSIRDTLRGLLWPDTRIAPVQLEQRQYVLPIPSYQVDKPVYPTRSTHSYRTAGYEALPVVYACVQKRAEAISAATVRVYREQGDGATEDLPDHPLRLLMRAPNPRLSEAEFLVQTSVMMDVAGFCLIEKVRARAGNILELWHLRPDWARPIYRADGTVDWEYRVPGRQVELIPDADVIVIPGGATLDMSVTGMSPIAVALREIGIENAATDFLKLYFDAGGAPRHAIVTPNAITDEAKAERLRAGFAAMFQGSRNWTNVPILSGGSDIKPISDTLQDMAYPDLRRMTAANICQVFGVPPVLVGAQVGLDSATYSNIQTARQIFYQDTIVPLWARIDGALTRSLLTELETDNAVSLEFDTSEIPALQEDVSPAWQRAQAALTAGGITLNQFQAEIGEDGFGPDGDVLYIPAMATITRPTDLPGQADQTAKPPQPVPPQLQNPPDPNAPADPNADPNAADATPPADANATKGGPEPDEKRTENPLEVRSMHVGGERIDLDAPLYRLPANQRSVTAAVNKGHINRLANQFAPHLRAFWKAQGERIVEDMQRSGDAAPERRDIAEIDWNDELDRLTELLLPHYDRAGTAATNRVAQQLSVGIAWDLANPWVRAVRKRLAEQIVGINDTTREDVQRVVTEALDEGVSMTELSDRLTGLFDETYQGRSMAVARTESQRSYNSASTAAYQASNKVAAAELMDNPLHGDYGGDADGLTCAQRDGMVVSLDDVDTHVFGTHPNCILAVAPVLYSPLGED